MVLNVSDLNDDSTDSENNDDNDNEYPVEEMGNETAELYITAGSWAKVLKEIRTAENISWPSMVNNPDMDDYPELREKHENKDMTSRLTVLAVCFKGEIGNETREENDHPIGLNNGFAPVSHQRYSHNDGSYALAHIDLPNINWEGLTDEEKEYFESNKVDLDNLGIDMDFEGPKLLKVNGERLPLGFNDDDLEKAEQILGALPEEPSAYTEDGFQESSDPSVFGEESDSKDDEPKAVEVPENGFDPRGLHIKDELEPNLTSVDDLDALREMFNIEKRHDDRKTAKAAINRRIRAVKPDKDEIQEGESRYAQNNTEASQNDVKKTVEEVEEERDEAAEELSEAEMGLMTALLNNEKNDVNSRDEAVAEVKSLQ